MTTSTAGNKKVIAKQMQKRLLEGTVEPEHVVIALVAMARAERIDVSDITPILQSVFFNNEEGVLRALIKAGPLLDKELIDSIVLEVETSRAWQ